MKTIFLLTCLMLTFYSLGQPILDTNSIWSEANKKFYYIQNDTVVVNDFTYKNVHNYNGTNLNYSDGEQTFLVREENDRIYWRSDYMNQDFLFMILDLV